MRLTRSEAIALDKYLTTPPDDGFDDFFEMVTERVSEKFWDENEDWILNDPKSDEIMIEVSKMDYQYEDEEQYLDAAAARYERLARIHLKENK